MKRRREVQLRRIAKGSKEDSDIREPLSELRSCVKVEEAVLSGVPSLISLMVYKCGRKAILNFNS